MGEGSSALIGFAILTAALAGLGAVHQLAVLDMVNPLRTLSYVGLGLDGSLRTAALLAVPAGFGLSLSTTSVLIYVNRRVPIALQVRTFAVQSSLKNSLAILPLLTAGAIASVVGVRPVLLAMPFVLLILAYGLIQLSRRFGGQSPRGNLDVLSTFWTGVETPSN